MFLHFPAKLSCIAVFPFCLLNVVSAFGARPTAEDALKLRPIQQEVDYDKPGADEQTTCTIQAEQSEGEAAWTVRGPGGQLLRRFVDTNADNKVDLWCYYRNGIEVYRDVDADFNGKADQYRWLGTAGTRWGLDRDQDGHIDAWKNISAEEVTAEAVAALRTGDAKRFRRLLVTPDEQKSLGLGAEKAKQLAEKVAAAQEAFADVAKRRALLSSSAKWLHFGGALPGVVPARTDGLEKDLTVYENVVAIVESDEGHRQVYIGTLVQVGTGWRLIDMPQILDRDESPAIEGFFFAARAPQPAVSDVPAVTSQAGRDAITELQQIDEQLATAPVSEQPKLHKKRADLLEIIIEHTTGQQEQSVWIRQYADTVSAAAQARAYPEGIQRLEKLLQKLKKEGRDKDLLASVEYPLREASYAISLLPPDADYPKIQRKWMQDLERFVKDYPSSPQSADAMVQLAISEEFGAKDTEAKAWYTQITREFPGSQQAKMAAGALRRIDCQGKPISIQGKSLSGQNVSLAGYRGKVTIVQYWATWCDACKKDMETLRGLLEKYGSRRVAVIGVNLDAKRDDAVRYVQQSRVPWEQLHEPGGMHSRLALELGILSLPTTLLVDSQGKVVNRNVHVSQVEDELKKLLQ
jgi:thiol-disulfide isomerase/thioredoxin